MRALLHATVMALALLGCAGRTPEPPEKPASYNRRELPPDQPGLFTGADGSWTLYRNDGARAAPAPAPAPEAAPPAPAPPKKREILMCGRGEEDCEQPDSDDRD